MGRPSVRCGAAYATADRSKRRRCRERGSSSLEPNLCRGLRLPSCRLSSLGIQARKLPSERAGDDEAAVSPLTQFSLPGRKEGARPRPRPASPVSPPLRLPPLPPRRKPAGLASEVAGIARTPSADSRLIRPPGLLDMSAQCRGNTDDVSKSRGYIHSPAATMISVDHAVAR